MTAPVNMCFNCANLAPADRPLDPVAPHNPLPTDGIIVREHRLLCQYHADVHDAATKQGGTAH